MNYKTYFKDKKVAVVGLGPHGEMLADVKFLVRSGAQVSLYDVRSEMRLQGLLPRIQEMSLAQTSLGKVNADDLLQSELIILSPEISRKSLFLKKAHEANIPIDFPHILFLKSAPAITLIGVMGACGKSTVCQMLYGMLKQSFSGIEDYGLFFIDPDLPNGALTHFRKIKAGDIVLARIPEEMMGEYHAARVSPHVAVITSLTAQAMQDVKKAFAILDFQTYNNFIVAPDDVIDAIKTQSTFSSKAKMLRTKRENSALARQTSELFKVDPEISQKVIESFTGLKGHQEFVKRIGGIEFYNDSASVNPPATLNALVKLHQKENPEKNIILIMGGAYTNYNYTDLVKNIPLYASIVILLPGSASLGFRSELEGMKDTRFLQAPTLEEAVFLAKENAKKGDRVLFSPGCEAIGIHISRKERGEKFVKAVRGL